MSVRILNSLSVSLPIPPLGSEALVEAACAKDKEMKLYNGFYHALLSEPDGGAEQVRDRLPIFP